MNYETEQKYRISDVKKLRRALTRVRARKLVAGQEENALYDRKGALRKRGLILRLRRMGSKGWLTFKGERLPGRHKKRLELEMKVRHAAMRKLLSRAGFRVAVRYGKWREVYQVSSCCINLDNLPRLGWFVEIEGSSPKICALQRKLGLQAENRVEHTYLELLKRVR